MNIIFSENETKLCVIQNHILHKVCISFLTTLSLFLTPLHWVKSKDNPLSSIIKKIYIQNRRARVEKREYGVKTSRYQNRRQREYEKDPQFKLMRKEEKL